MGKQCWSQAVLESGSWGHSALQTPALVKYLLWIYIKPNVAFNVATNFSLLVHVLM